MIGPMETNSDTALLEQIVAMEDGPEKDALMAQLTTDYEGRGGAISDEMELAQGDIADSFDMPGVRSGPAGNPYARDVAPNPMEYLSKGLRNADANYRKYKGGRAQEENFGQEEDLRERDMNAQIAAMLRNRGG